MIVKPQCIYNKMRGEGGGLEELGEYFSSKCIISNFSIFTSLRGSVYVFIHFVESVYVSIPLYSVRVCVVYVSKTLPESVSVSIPLYLCESLCQYLYLAL